MYYNSMLFSQTCLITLLSWISYDDIYSNRISLVAMQEIIAKLNGSKYYLSIYLLLELFLKIGGLSKYKILLELSDAPILVAQSFGSAGI